jgi:hypothetical protein
VVGDLVLRLKQDGHGKNRVPMGGTLHHDRSNTRRSLSTTRQEDRERWEQPVECRTTLAVLCIEGVWRQELSSYDPLNPEHEDTGRVLWVNSTICIAYFWLVYQVGISDWDTDILGWNIWLAYLAGIPGLDTWPGYDIWSATTIPGKCSSCINLHTTLDLITLNDTRGLAPISKKLMSPWDWVGQPGG